MSPVEIQMSPALLSSRDMPSCAPTSVATPRSLASSPISCAASKLQGVHSRLINTLKSHKVPLEFRNIHACPQSTFSGLSWRVKSQLEAKPRDLPHIIASNDSFLRDVRKMCRAPNSHFLRLDAKSFFMSGTPPTLSADAAAIIADGPILSDLLRRATCGFLKISTLSPARPTLWYAKLPPAADLPIPRPLRTPRSTLVSNGGSPFLSSATTSRSYTLASIATIYFYSMIAPTVDESL